MTHSASYRRILNRMGYYNYQRGLIYHHLEEDGSWSSHLRNCREFILKSLNVVNPRIVTVLGSGWLMDLPLKEIAESVSQVNLVDIVHPPEVKDQVAAMKNVILREDDVTGGLIMEVWKKTRTGSFLKKFRSFDEINIREYFPQYDPGMIISLNILTQLESLPLEFLKKRSVRNDDYFLKFRKEIQAKHISFLSKQRSVLIADVSEIETDRTGEVTENQSLLADLPESTLAEEWTWNFDYKRSDYYSRKSVFRVRAILT